MFIAFGTAALMLLTLSAYGHIPIVFVLATAVYFGVFGEIYSLFPATSGDTFGGEVRHHQQRHAVHGERHRLVAGAAGEHHRGQIRLAGGVRDRGCAQTPPRHCSPCS